VVPVIAADFNQRTPTGFTTWSGRSKLRRTRLGALAVRGKPADLLWSVGPVLTPGRTYVLTMRVRSSLAGDGLLLVDRSWNESGAKLATASARAAVGTEWQTVTMTLAVPAGTTKTTIAMLVRGRTLLIDDMAITPAP
jgi:hypothetical protein